MNQKPMKPSIGSLIGVGASKPKTVPAPSTAIAAASSRQELRAKLGATVNPAPQKRALQAGTSVVGTISKKARIHVKSVNLASIPGTSTSSGGIIDGATAAMAPLLAVDEAWKENVAEIDVNSLNFEAIVCSQREKGKPVKRVVCAAVKALQSTSTIDSDFGLQIVKVVGQEDHLLRNVSVLHALMSLLNNGGCSNKLTMELLEVVGTMLEKLDVWSASLVHYGLNDSLGSRVWVDRPQASQLLQSILSYFGPVSFPQESAFVSTGLPFTYREPFVGTPKFQIMPTGVGGAMDRDHVRTTVLAHFDKAIEGGQLTKNLLRTISLCTSLPEVRLLASKRLDTWLQNGKVQRQAMELLLYVGSNTRDLSGEEDRQIISYLLKMRALKSKQVSAVFANFIAELVGGRPDSLDHLISLLVDNEFAAPLIKHPFNLPILNMVFGQSFESFSREKAAHALVKKLIDRVHTHEAIKPAKLLLRDLMRFGVRQIDFPFHVFSKALFSHFFASHATRTTALIRELLLDATVELAAILPLLAMSQQLKDSVQQKRGGGIAALSSAQNDGICEFHAQLKSFFDQVLVFLKFLSGTSPAVDGAKLLRACASLLYLDAPASAAQSSFDSWPSDAEIGQLMRIVSEHPVDGTSVCELMDLLERAKIPAGAQLDICEALTSRSRGELILRLPNSPQLIHRIFKLSLLTDASSGDVDVTCDDGGGGRRLADANLYWRGWLLAAVWLCVGGTARASPILKKFYDEWPTLRLMLAMCISRDFSFPPRKLDGVDGAKLAEEERRLREAESALAIERRGVMAPGSVCYHDLGGAVRQPPQWCIAKLRQWNDELGMDLRLTRSRDPDILLQLSRDQGQSKTVGAALKLIKMDATEVDNVPLECLCQLLMLDAKQSGCAEGVEGSAEYLPEELRSLIFSKLRDHLHGEGSEPHAALTIISFYLSVLASALPGDRDASLQTLHQLSVKTDEKLSHEAREAWDLSTLASIRQFNAIADDVCTALSKCCQAVMSDSQKPLHYIEFLRQHASTRIADEIAQNLAHVSSQSSGDSVRRALLRFYASYMQTRVSSRKDSHPQSPNMIGVTVGGGSFKIPAEVARAQLELLCGEGVEGEEVGDAAQDAHREYLMNIWFPFPERSVAPIAAATVGSTELLSRDLRLKMLSSRNERIVLAALSGVTKAEQALEFMQSFGLPERSCAQLVSILTKVSLEGVEQHTVIQALPFLRAYAHKGIAGAGELLERLRQAGLVPEQTKPIFTPEPEMAHTSDTRMDCSSAANVEREKLVVAPESVESSTADLVKEFLKDCAGPQATRSSSRSAVQPAAASTAHLCAEKILDTLANDQQMSDQKISQLLHRHSMLRPEIFPTSAEVGDSEKEMKALFKRESPAIRHLVSQIPFRCSFPVVRKLVGTLLDKFDNEVVPSLVLSFMDANVNNASVSCRVAPTPSQCSTLMLYLAKEIEGMESLHSQLTVEELAGTKQLLGVMRFVGANEIRTRVIKAAEKLEAEMGQNQGTRRRRVVKMLTDVLKKHFPYPPRIKTLTFAEDGSENGSIGDFDRTLHRLITDLFGLISSCTTLPAQSEERGDAERLALETMRSILREADVNKELMARQIPLLSTHLSSMVVQITPRQLREQTTHVRYMETTIEVLVRAAPYSITHDVESAARTLQVCINFFKENAMRIRGWSDLMLLTMKATLKLAELGGEGRVDAFLTKNEGAIREIGANLKDSAEVQSLLLNLPRRSNAHRVQ